MRQTMYAALAKDPQAKLPATQAAVQASQKADSIANDLLAGEATKGLLLTAYGFSILGDRAGQAALTCFIIAGALALAAAALLVLSRRRRDRTTRTIDFTSAEVEASAPQPTAAGVR